MATAEHIAKATIRQRSPEWFAARRGKVTASSLYRVFAKPGTKSHEGYKRDLILDLEGLEGWEDTPPWFEHGTETEKYARGAYEHEYDIDVIPAGFVIHPQMPYFGCSPDGYPGEGLIEIKCRSRLQTFLGACERISRNDGLQIQGQLSVTGRPWCDYVNYFEPNGEPGGELHVQRVFRDEDRIREIESKVRHFYDGISSNA